MELLIASLTLISVIVYFGLKGAAADEKERDLQTLETHIKAASVNAARRRANMTELPGVDDAFVAALKRLTPLLQLPAQASVVAPDGSISPVVPTPTVPPVPAPESFELRAESSTIFTLDQSAQIVVGFYPDFEMFCATLEVGGDVYKLKTFSSAEDHELVCSSARLLGRSVYESILNGSYPKEATAHQAAA